MHSNSYSLQSMAGETGKIVDVDHDQSNSLLRVTLFWWWYVVPHSSCSIYNVTTQNETVQGSSKSFPTYWSFLSALQRPASSDLWQKRTTQQNPPKGEKHKASSSYSTNPKSVTIAQRCLEFQDEPFTASAGKLLL